MTDDSNIMDSASPWEIGFGGFPDPSNPLADVDALQQLVEAAELHHNNATQAIRDLITECLDDCQSLTSGCVDCVTGAIIRKLDDAEKLSQKADDKVYAAIVQAIGQAEQATNNVLQLADIVQGNVPEPTPDGINREPFNEEVPGPTQAELEEIAFNAGETYRNVGINPPVFLADNPIDTIPINQPIGTNPPGGTTIFPVNPPTQGTPTNTKIPDGCHCPTGSKWSGLPNGPNGEYVFACYKPDGSKAELLCDDTISPTPPGDCVEIDTYAPCTTRTVVLCKDGVPLTPQQIQDWCFLCNSGQFVQNCFNGTFVPDPPYSDDGDLTCEAPPQAEKSLGRGVLESPADATTYGSTLTLNTGIGMGPIVDPVGTITGTVSDILCNWPLPDAEPPTKAPSSEIVFDYCCPDDWSKASSAQDDVNNTVQMVCDTLSTSVMFSGSNLYKRLIAGQKDAGWLQKSFIFLGSIVVTILMLLPCILIQVISFAIPLPRNCKNATGIGMALVRSFVQFFGNLLQLVPKQWVSAIEHISNYNCQSELPQANDITQARLAGKLTQNEWEFGMKLHGVCIPWAQTVLDAGRPFIPANVVFGWARAELIDEEEKKGLLKRVALEDETQIANFEFASEAIPPYQDLIRLMVRDVFDDEIAEKYRTDDDFDKKFNGQAKEWALRQNITEDIFKKQWRAHWQLPSDGQFFEMLHRLRPEKGLTDSLDNPLAVTKEDITEALKINDVMPFWIDRLTAISYRPLGIRQIARAYETNVITKKDATGFYQDLGYKEEDAKILSDYLVTDSAERRAKFLGRPLPSIVEKAFIAGEVSEETFKSLLSSAGLPEEIIGERIAYARAKASLADTTEIYKSIRKQFLQGKVNEQEYKAKLLRENFDQQRVDEIIRRDNEVKTARSKEIAVGKMCKLVEQGLLDPADYFARAVNLGYKVEDATLLVRSCLADVQEALRKKVQAAIDKAAAAAARAEALAERARKAELARKKAEFPCQDPPKPKCPPGVRESF